MLQKIVVSAGVNPLICKPGGFGRRLALREPLSRGFSLLVAFVRNADARKQTTQPKNWLLSLSLSLSLFLSLAFMLSKRMRL